MLFLKYVKIFQVTSRIYHRQSLKISSHVITILLVDKKTVPIEDILDYNDDVLIPYDITITKKNDLQDILHLHLDLKDVETIFEVITEIVHIVDEVKI